MIVGVLTLAGVAWWEYGRILHAPFICDDFVTLDLNPSMLRLWPVFSISGERTPLNPSPETPVAARPLVNLSFAVNYHLGGKDPAGYRLVNIGIHLLAALVLWALVRRTLLLEYFAARFHRVAGVLGFASALVWAVHPLNTESIAYTTQRTESLMGLFYLATLYACLRYWTATRPLARASWLVLATLACLAGALSKEMMASAPAVALAYERTFLAGNFRRALRQSWPLYLGLALGWLPFLVINFNGPLTPAAGFHLGLPAYVWWFTQAKVLLLYLKLAFWPWPLVLHYEIPYIETVAAAWPWLLPVGLMGIATAVLFWRRSSAGFVALSVVAVLSPTLVVPCVGEIVAERRMYVALAALAPLVIVGTYEILQRTARRATAPRASDSVAQWPFAIWIVGVTAVAVAFTLVSVRRLAAYKDALTLLEDTVANQPDDFSILINYGVELTRAGRPEEALKPFGHALWLMTESPLRNYKLNLETRRLHGYIGLAYEQMNRPREAMEQYKQAIQAWPENAAARYNLARLLNEFGLLEAAMDQYKEAVRIKPTFAQAHCNLGALLAGAGRYDEAIAHLEEGVRLDPDAGSYVNLVDAYTQTGRRDDAIGAAKQAVLLARENGQADLADQIEAWLARFRADDPRR